MRAAVRAARLAALLWIAAGFPAPGRAQQVQPLRKTDLIRVLTGGSLSKAEIADLVRRNCLSFRPTPRDRQDLVALGADSVILRNMDTCAAAAASPPVSAAARPSRPPPAQTRPPAAAPATPAPRPVVSPPVRVVTPPATVAAPPAAAAPVVPRAAPSAARTGFVSGLGQRGMVGQRAALPLVFDVRDSTGRSLAGVPVTLTVSNGRLLSPSPGAVTDSTGQVRGEVVLGERAAPTVVTAAVGRIVRQAVLYPSAGPPARLVATVNGQSVERQLAIDPDVITSMHVAIQDAFGNPVAGPGVVAAVADGGVMKVMGVTPDSLGATVQLRPGRAGGSSTTLALQAGSVRLDLRASVRARAPR